MARDSRGALGAWGERLAERYLKGLGYRVLARNLRLRSAELDIVALEGRTLCFIEVRTRRARGFGTPEESIDARKRARLVRAASAALREYRWPRWVRLRFDVVAIDAQSDPPEIRLIRDAFYVDRR